MRGNSEAAAFVDDLADFTCGRAFQIGNGRADAEQVAFRGRDFLPRDDEKAIDRCAVLSHQTLFQQISDRITGVVIGDGEAMQALGAGRRNVVFRARHAISRKEGVGVEVDLEGHRREASFGGDKWKASVSKSGRSSAKHSDAASRALSCARAGSRKVEKGSLFVTRSSFFSPLTSTSRSRRRGWSARDDSTARAKVRSKSISSPKWSELRW